MQSNDYLLMKTSIIYRSALKFAAKELGEYDLGLTHLLILIIIHENEGITQQGISNIGNFDKGTVTKTVQKLEELNFVKTLENPNNHREKMVYVTDQAKTIISNIYLKRQSFFEKLTKGLSNKEIDDFQKILTIIGDNARDYVDDSPDNVKIFGLQKLTLLDFPGKMGATIFLGGCNFRCPFCHNSELVFLDEDVIQIPTDDVLEYLEKRKNVLDGVCISGGEPLLQPGVVQLARQIKELGYMVKIDTNGTNPKLLKEMVEEGIVDYVAMDIKNCLDKYGLTVGINNIELDNVQKSVQYLIENHVDYEFRTTVVNELHESADFEKMGEWLKGAKRLYLQKFVPRETVIKGGLSAPSDQQLRQYREILKKHIENVEIRGEQV